MTRFVCLGVFFVCSGTVCADYPPPAQVKAAFLKLLDRPRVPPDAQIIETRPIAHGLVLEHLRFASEKKADGALERVPTYLVRPARRAGKLPAIIALHGTGGSGKSQVPLLVELAKHGFIGIAIDARYHGERAGGAKGAAAYNQAITRAWRSKPGAKHEHPFYYDTCWDLWRLVDYLETRPDVDAKKLGMIGFSMGGIEAWLAASVDSRIEVTVPAIAVQSFRWSLEHDRWHGRANTIGAAHKAAAKDLGEEHVNQEVCRALWKKVIPGILDDFDCPSMIRLFAGRPLLILNGAKDGNCPLPGAKLAFAAAEKAFADAGAADKLRIMVAENTGHSVTKEQRQAALAWFERWLKGTETSLVSDPKIVVVTLGDSITRGVRSGVKPEETFAARIEAGLRKREIAAKVINAGIGGERTDQALKRLDSAVIALKPQFVTIMYGTNDSYVDRGETKPRLTVDEYQANLRVLVAGLHQAGIKPLLMTPPAWGSKAKNGAGADPNILLAKYVRACRKVAADTKTPLVDHFAHWSKQSAAGVDIGAAWTTDQCHPNPRGHEEMAEMIVPVMIRAMQAQR